MRLTMPALFKASQPGTVVAEWHAYVTSMVRLKRRDARSIEPQRRRLCRTRSRRRLMRSPRSVQVAAAILAMLGSSVSMCGCGGGGGPADSGSDATRTSATGRPAPKTRSHRMAVARTVTWMPAWTLSSRYLTPRTSTRHAPRMAASRLASFSASSGAHTQRPTLPNVARRARRG